jgi:hypothetical protein
VRFFLYLVSSLTYWFFPYSMVANMKTRTLSFTLMLALIAPVAALAAQARAGAPPAQAGRVVAAPTPPLPVPDMTSTNAFNPPSPDPRIGLAPAGNGQPSGEAIWNMKHLSNTPPSPASASATHSDLAFKGPYVFQGNYNGFEVWDITNPVAPRLMASPTCPASQDDISVRNVYDLVCVRRDSAPVFEPLNPARGQIRDRMPSGKAFYGDRVSAGGGVVLFV